MKSTMPPLALNVGAPEIVKAAPRCMVPDVAVNAPLDNLKAPATDIDPDDPRNVPPDIAKVVERVVLPEGAVKVPLDKTNAPLVVSVA